MQLVLPQVRLRVRAEAHLGGHHVLYGLFPHGAQLDHPAQLALHPTRPESDRAAQLRPPPLSSSPLALAARRRLH